MRCACMADECPVAYLTVSGCAASPFDVGAHTLQVVFQTERNSGVLGVVLLSRCTLPFYLTRVFSTRTQQHI